MMIRFWLYTPFNMFLIVAGLLLLMVAAQLHLNDDNTYMYYTTVLLGGYYLAVRPTYAWMSYKEVYKSAKVFTHKSDYLLTDDKFFTKGYGHEQHLNWDYFYAIANRKDVFILYQNVGVANIILKKWLTPEQLQEFEQFLRARGYIKQ